jgi:uncharacterized protein YbaR (Trm112 family)
VNEELLRMLGCPLDDERTALQLIDGYLYCPNCKRYFPVVDGIPHLLPESALTQDQVHPT